MSIQDTQQSSWSIIHILVLKYMKLKVREHSDVINISVDHNVVHEHFGTEKRSARWFLRLLTVDRKHARIFQQCLDTFRPLNWVSATFHCCWWNFDLLLHPWIEATLQIVGWNRFKVLQWRQNFYISRKSHCLSVFGRSLCDSHKRSGKRQSNYRRILRRIIGEIEASR